MGNPYESPGSTISDDPSGGAKGELGIGRTSFVGQVMVVAILMIIHGLMVMCLGGAGTFFWLKGSGEFKEALKESQELQKEMEKQRREENPGRPARNVDVLGPNFAEGMTAAIAIGAGLLTAIGLLSVVAGIMNLRYRGRGLGILSLMLGFGASLTCYCAPTAIALGVYGLVVYFNADVARAFAGVKRGYTPADVKAAARQYGA